MEFQHELVIPDEGLPFKFFLFEGSQGNYVREKHWHTSIEIFAVMEGSLTFYLNDEKHPLKAGELMIINSNEVHSIDSPEENHTAVLQIPLKQFEDYFTAHRFIRFAANEQETDSQLWRLIREMYKLYGKRGTGYDFTELLKEMKHTPVPEDVTYVPSVEEMEALPVAKELQNKGYGGLPIEIGYCNGHNKKLNGLEYHRSSEINVAVTDLVLLIGHQQDVEKDYTYDTSKAEAFLVPAGTAIEVYATTLHYAPCHVNESGFQCVVVLPKGTNTELTFEKAAEGEDKLLTAKNKWLIGHEEAAIEGAFNGLKGENVGID